MLNFFQHLTKKELPSTGVLFFILPLSLRIKKKQPQNVVFCDDGDGLFIGKRAYKRNLQMLQTECPTQRIKALLVKVKQSILLKVS